MFRRVLHRIACLISRATVKFWTSLCFSISRPHPRRAAAFRRRTRERTKARTEVRRRRRRRKSRGVSEIAEGPTKSRRGSLKNRAIT